MSKYSQGVCADGAAILRDGQPMTVDEIVSALNRADLAAERERELVDALKSISSGRGFGDLIDKAAGMRIRAFDALAAHESRSDFDGQTKPG